MVEEVLLPFLLKSCSSSNPLEHQPGVQKVLDLMWVCMEVSCSNGGVFTLLHVVLLPLGQSFSLVRDNFLTSF